MKEELDLRISAADAALLENPDEALLLGLIMSDGEVHLKVADANETPGHFEWMSRDKIPPVSVRGGFSLIVKSGQITHLFRSSRLNAASDGSLRRDQVNAILKLVPVADMVKVL